MKRLEMLIDKEHPDFFAGEYLSLSSPSSPPGMKPLCSARSYAPDYRHVLCFIGKWQGQLF